MSCCGGMAWSEVERLQVDPPPPSDAFTMKFTKEDGRFNEKVLRDEIYFCPPQNWAFFGLQALGPHTMLRKCREAREKSREAPGKSKEAPGECRKMPGECIPRSTVSLPPHARSSPSPSNYLIFQKEN